MGEKTKLTPDVVILTGIDDPTLVSVDPDGDYFTNSGRTFIKVKNAHGTLTRTVTVVSQVNCNYGENHPAPCVLAAGETKLFGPFPKDRFNDSDGYCQITYSDAGDSLTIAVIEVP